MSSSPAPRPIQAADQLLAQLLKDLGHSAQAWGTIEERPPESLPEPQRSLLVHPRDMTRTLEAYLEARLALRTLARQQQGQEALVRQVVLHAQSDRRVLAEVGAIRILLGHLPAPARDEVLAESAPLGDILHRHGVVHYGQPQAYFACRANEELAELLQTSPGRELWGRVSRLRRRDNDQVLAEAIEILPAFELTSDEGQPSK